MAYRQRGNLAAHEADRLQAGGVSAAQRWDRSRRSCRPRWRRAWPRSTVSARWPSSTAPRSSTSWMPSLTARGVIFSDLHTAARRAPRAGAARLRQRRRDRREQVQRAQLRAVDQRLVRLCAAQRRHRAAAPDGHQPECGQAGGDAPHGRRDRGRRVRDAGGGLHRRGRRHDQQRRRAAAGRQQPGALSASPEPGRHRLELQHAADAVDAATACCATSSARGAAG